MSAGVSDFHVSQAPRSDGDAQNLAFGDCRGSLHAIAIYSELKLINTLKKGKTKLSKLLH